MTNSDSEGELCSSWIHISSQTAALRTPQRDLCSCECLLLIFKISALLFNYRLWRKPISLTPIWCEAGILLVFMLSLIWVFDMLSRTTSPVTIFTLALILHCCTRNKLSFLGYSQISGTELVKNHFYRPQLRVHEPKEPKIYILSTSRWCWYKWFLNRLWQTLLWGTGYQIQ